MRILLAIIVLMSGCAAQTECGDYLQQFGIEIAAQYQGCEYFEETQIHYYEAKYKVAQKNFLPVSNVLAKRYGMPELKWACCSYATAGWSIYEFNGHEYSVHMHSDDVTEEAQQPKNFWVTVRLYTHINI